jgi:hypothetical protein
LYFNFVSMTLSREEEGFIEYWEQNRIRKKRVFRQLGLGLPLGVMLVVAIFVNFFSGWYKRADMELHSGGQSSLILVLLIAALLIVAFVVIFSVRHKWEMNEQYYKELLARKDQ